ncbi:L,D-transpeptidase family protein [Actinomyces slackii]|uniref:Uncharacterized vancomycin resistance protein n=1 Tax=Actinomyces slackii TaxID=52774 RepID=A0A3S4SK92_9ACTO|nr:L,D-transpeptidase family protein [Actinomyces slackii]VEG74659.1 Uncharacterized vancomycin resistance protein [Actinomyces slackii]
MSNDEFAPGDPMTEAIDAPQETAVLSSPYGMSIASVPRPASSASAQEAGVAAPPPARRGSGLSMSAATPVEAVEAVETADPGAVPMAPQDAPTPSPQPADAVDTDAVDEAPVASAVDAPEPAPLDEPTASAVAPAQGTEGAEPLEAAPPAAPSPTAGPQDEATDSAGPHSTGMADQDETPTPAEGMPAQGPMRTSILRSEPLAPMARATAADAPLEPEPVEPEEPALAASHKSAGSADAKSTDWSREPVYDAGPRRRRWPLWVAAASFLLLGGVGAAGYAYASHYDDLAVPGTTVAGTDVAGKSREEIVKIVQDKAGEATVSISGDVTATATLAEAGATVDAEATADAVMAHGDGIVDRFRALVSDKSIPVVVTTDEQAAADYATGLIPADRAKAVNASVVLGEDGSTFSITPSSAGTSLDSASLSQAATKAAQSLSPTSVELTFSTSDPAVSDAQAQTVADKANTWVSQDVVITVGDDESYTADTQEKASWITISESPDSAPTIAVDSGKVGEWVTLMAQDAHKDPVNGVRNVNPKGQVVETSVEAENGRTIDNADAVTASIVESLGAGKAYSGSFETTTVEATWKDRTIAEGAEKLPYQAAPDEKWIDVNLTNYTVTAYQGATVVRGPMSMVDGAAETPTVEGTYKVYLQYPSQTMEGDNVDGTRYKVEDVPWVTYFHEGYAFHGAPWRSSFGYSASHGCVNMTVADAQWIYSWVSTGTTVVSHR